MPGDTVELEGGTGDRSVVVPGCTVGTHPVPPHNLGSSSDPSAQSITSLHRRSPSMQAP